MMSLSPYNSLHVSVTFRHSAVAGVSETEQAFAMSVCAPHCLCRLSFAKTVQASGKRACSLFPERSLSYAKMVQGESNDKVEKQSFYNFGIAEPKFILCKGENKISFPQNDIPKPA